MVAPTKEQIVNALTVLREALVARFGDVATGASMGEGCDINVRCAGIDLLDEECGLIVNDGEPDEVADALLEEQ